MTDDTPEAAIERVAIAICHNNYGDLSLSPDAASKRWEASNEMQRSMWRQEASVAISAFLQIEQ